MKKLLFCSFFLFVAQWLMAADNTDLRHARQKAAGFWGTTPVKLVATATGETPAYYVFNAQRAEKGFVIVAGHDNSTILGYSDNGEFDPANMPPQLQDMLDAYSEMVATKGSHAAATQRAPEVHEAIAPLITTKWGQQAPYNKLLPNNPTTSGQQFKYTGCVATAMAQIMKFYASPTATQPIPSYTYYLSKDGSSSRSSSAYSGGYTISPQGLPSTQFNYDLMKDDYNSGYTEEEGNAVAELMLYCAQAAKMMYKNLSSGATTSSEYFSDYFGYSEDHDALSRSDYSAYEWDRLLYNELKENRPVLMSGHKPTGGHAFICDGYKNGMFHFNWGWNGSYEGYFNLAEMNPYGSGDGDAAGRDGYSLNLRAFINLRPAGADVPTNTALTLNDMFVVNSGTRVDSKVYTRSSSSEAFTVNIMQTVTNNTGSQRDFKVGYRPYKNVDGTGPVTGYVTKTMTEFPNSYYSNVPFTINFPSATYPDGTYYIRGLSNISTASTLKKDINANLYYIKVVIEGNTLTAYSASKVENMTFNSVTLEGPKKVNREMVARASVTNNGNVPTSTAYLFVDGKMSTGVGVYVDPGETGEVVMHFIPTTAGTHDLKIYNTENTSGTLLWSGSVDISERQEPNLNVTTWTIANREGYNIKGTTFKLTLTVKNNAAEAYDDVITFKLCKKASLSTTTGTVVQTKTQDVSIPAGSSKNVEVSFDDLVIGGYYFVNTYVYKPSTVSDLRISSIGTYTIIEDPTGIETITTAPAEQAQKEVYDLNGRRIGTTGSRLSKGIYIVGGKKHVVK
ncbi:MAG: C10 family peptidase [Prevotella sp.]|nr:C10 family peptidase [Prevotella sp.]